MTIFTVLYNLITHKKTSYYRITHNSYYSTINDTGKYGEYLIYRCLQKYEKDSSRFLFNVYIPKENEETTEIDVIMISPHGVFVFESKNYSGWIFGNAEQLKWTQTLPQGRGRSHKEHFYNPIMQNASHVKHLRSLIGESIPIHSVIVFSERCTLKNVAINDDSIFVIKRDELSNLVKYICSQSETVALTKEEIKKIYESLFRYTQVDDSIKQQHIANINSHTVKNDVDTQYTESSAEIHQPNIAVCPKCGGTLVLRTAKRGENAGNTFYGCSNYPKCRYIKAVETSTPI